MLWSTGEIGRLVEIATTWRRIPTWPVQLLSASQVADGSTGCRRIQRCYWCCCCCCCSCCCRLDAMQRSTAIHAPSTVAFNLPHPFIVRFVHKWHPRNGYWLPADGQRKPRSCLNSWIRGFSQSNIWRIFRTRQLETSDFFFQES